MQITFDPTDKREAEYVRKLLDNRQEITGSVDVRGTIISEDLQQRAEAYAEYLRQKREHTHITPEDNPETGAPAAPSAIPLPPEVPAPSIAAADVFPIAPAVPQASIPQPPPVPAPPAATAPPPAAVPSAPAAPTNHASGVQLDKRGLPHDVRIHSKEPTLTESGVWRKRRGLNDEAYVKRIEEELLQLMAIPTLGAPAPSAAPLSTVAPPAVAPALSSNTTGGVPANVSPVMVPAVSPVPTPPAPVAATVSVPPPPVTSVIPPAPPAPPAPVGAPSTVPTAPPATVPASITVPATFAELMKLVTSNITARRLTEADVHEALREVGLGDNDIGKLNNRMDLGALVGTKLINVMAARGA
jgi:hypothetical protein